MEKKPILDEETSLEPWLSTIREDEVREFWFRRVDGGVALQVTEREEAPRKSGDVTFYRLTKHPERQVQQVSWPGVAWPERTLTTYEDCIDCEYNEQCDECPLLANGDSRTVRNIRSEPAVPELNCVTYEATMCVRVTRVKGRLIGDAGTSTCSRRCLE